MNYKTKILITSIAHLSDNLIAKEYDYMHIV